jgi:hypothetical protein
MKPRKTEQRIIPYVKFVICLSFFLIGGNVFGQTSQPDLWKSKVFYVGGSWGLGPIIGPDGAVLGGNLSPVRLDWQMIRFLALQTQIGFYFGPQARQTAVKETDPASGIMETYAGTETHIIFPLLLKLTLKPGIFSFDIGGGLYAAPAVMNTTVERTNDNGYTVSEAYGRNLFTLERGNPFGFVAGGSAGVKVGQGILFLDVNYLRDFSETTLKFKDAKIGQHLWNTLAIDMGFKYGILNSK